MLPQRCRIAVMALVVCTAMGGCKDNKGKAEATSDVAPEDDSGLIERRDALLETRRTLALQRAELDEKRSELEASGGDISVIEKQVTELVKKEREVERETSALNDEFFQKFKEQQAKLSAVAGKLSGEARVTARESSIASRESSLAKRERELAAREAALATREEQLATKWKDGCAAGGSIFSMPSVPAGTKYRKRDVEKNIRKAQKNMRKRGILQSDLPAGLKGLMREAQNAMKKGDYGRAFFAAEQLASGVQSLKIDRRFLRAKYDRVKKSVSGNLSDRDAKLLTQFTTAFGDGRYTTANRRLNELINR